MNKLLGLSYVALTIFGILFLHTFGEKFYIEEELKIENRFKSSILSYDIADCVIAQSAGLGSGSMHYIGRTSVFGGPGGGDAVLTSKDRRIRLNIYPGDGKTFLLLRTVKPVDQKMTEIIAKCI